MAQSISYSPVCWNEIPKAALERLLGTCQQHQMVMEVLMVASQIMTWAAVQEMEHEELLHNIGTLNPFKVHPEKVWVAISATMPRDWWSSSQPTGTRVNSAGLKQLIGEACLFFSEAVVALSELIEDTDKKIVELSSLLYHHTDRLNTLETLTGLEFELIEKWVATVKGLDQQGNTECRPQSR
ncbi:hypothetical protein J3A83DRAFT_4189813 [Scleroderma citrinum]